MILYCIAPSFASYSVFFWTGTWSHCLWNLFIIEGLLSPPVLKSKAGYDTLRMHSTGISLGSHLFSSGIYSSDLPVTISRKFFYGNDLAILHCASNWQALEGTLIQDMATQSSYLYKWKLKLSTAKTVSSLPSLQ